MRTTLSHAVGVALLGLIACQDRGYPGQLIGRWVGGDSTEQVIVQEYLIFDRGGQGYRVERVGDWVMSDDGWAPNGIRKTPSWHSDSIKETFSWKVMTLPQGTATLCLRFNDIGDARCSGMIVRNTVLEVQDGSVRTLYHRATRRTR